MPELSRTKHALLYSLYVHNCLSPSLPSVRQSKDFTEMAAPATACRSRIPDTTARAMAMVMVMVMSLAVPASATFDFTARRWLSVGKSPVTEGLPCCPFSVGCYYNSLYWAHVHSMIALISHLMSHYPTNLSIYFFKNIKTGRMPSTIGCGY